MVINYSSCSKENITGNTFVPIDWVASQIKYKNIDSVKNWLVKNKINHIKEGKQIFVSKIDLHFHFGKKLAKQAYVSYPTDYVNILSDFVESSELFNRVVKELKEQKEKPTSIRRIKLVDQSDIKLKNKLVYG